MSRPSPQRVLITDDDPASRSTAAALLSPAGYSIRFASGGEEALAAIVQEMPDLLLLDVMMPGMSGFEVCRRLRELQGEDYLPIILLTALDGRREVVEGLEAGADDFLHKPVRGAELRARVSNLLKVRAYHRLLAAQRDTALATVDSLRQHVLHADRLATVGTFAAGISHELNNISQVLRVAVEGLGRPATHEGEEQEIRDMLVHATNHVTELARSILHIARPTDDQPAEANLGRTLEQVRDMLRITGRIRHAQLSLVLPEPACLIRANPVHAQQVFLNLVNNAADAVMDVPAPRIEMGVRTAPDGSIEAWVEDNGPGMTEEVRSHLFQPFFTTKAPGTGTGLGLSVVKQLVEAWGGRIHVATQPGAGTRIVLSLPATGLIHTASSSA